MTWDRENLEWIWPDWDKVFVIEFTLSTAIVGILMALSLTIYAPYVSRARLTEAWVALGAKRYDLTEQLAISGAPVEIPLVDSMALAPAASVDELLSGRKPISLKQIGKSVGLKPIDIADTAQTKEQIQKFLLDRETDSGSTQYVSSLRIVGNAIVASGKVDGRDYEVGVFPAALEDEESRSVYIWLCQRRRIPEGWLAQPPSLMHPLPDQLLIRECRRAGRT